MNNVTRTASFRIDGATRDPDGYLICDARLTKTGIFTYKKDGKEVRELRPYSEVFKSDSLKTYVGAPATVRHPRSGFVTPKNHRLLSVGTLLDARPNKKYVVGRIKITDSAVADKVESGELCEVSLGYRADLAPSKDPLVADRVQRNIVVNHIALLYKGEARLGSDVSIMRLDSADNVIIEDNLMTTENVERTDAELTEEPKEEASVEETKTDSEETAAPEEQAEKTDAEEQAEETAAPEEQAEKTDAEESAPAEDSTKEDTPAEDAANEAPSEGDEPASEEAADPNEAEENNPDQEEPAPAWATALDAKLDSILEALKPSENTDSTTEEKTDSKDIFEAAVQRSVRARLIHSTVLSEEKQDGLSDRELALQVIKRFDSKFELGEESTDALISMAEWAAKVNREDSTENGFRSRFRSSIRSGSNKTDHMDALDKILGN